MAGRAETRPPPSGRNATGESESHPPAAVGTVRDLIDSAGNLELHRQYDAFGRVTSQTGAADTAAVALRKVVRRFGGANEDTRGASRRIRRQHSTGGWQRRLLA